MDNSESALPGIRLHAVVGGSAPSFLYDVSKRVLDLALAVVLLLATSPILAFALLAIALDSPGPPLFRQSRCGRGRRTFGCLKLRTMVNNAESLLGADASLTAEYSGLYKIDRDPRVTAVGRWLRRTSIDEMPQLWNVIRGDMSLVGPRPVLPDELDRMYGPQADLLVSVRPGLTGLWQTSGRSALSYARRVELDCRYVRDRGLAMDIRILALTPLTVLSGKGAV